jgi:ankyrin repeat protein
MMDMVDFLLNNGADVSRMDADGNTSLHIACEKGHHEDMVRLLVNRGIDVNVMNDKGESPLRCAFDNAHVFTIIWMISYTTATVREDVLCGFSKSHETLLQVLCRSNVDQTTVLNFFDNGIRINGSELKCPSKCTDSTKCLLRYVEAYGLPFTKNLIKHGLVGCSRKCLLLMDYLQQATQMSYYYKPIYHLDDICQW